LHIAFWYTDGMKIEEEKYNDLAILYQKLLEKNCYLIEENVALHNLTTELRRLNKKLDVKVRKYEKELRMNDVDTWITCGKTKK